MNLPALLQSKNTRLGPFPRKWSVLQNPDWERTNQSAEICPRLALPYNKKEHLTLNEAKRTNLHGNKRILKWRPCWKKGRCIKAFGLEVTCDNLRGTLINCSCPYFLLSLNYSVRLINNILKLLLEIITHFLKFKDNKDKRWWLQLIFQHWLVTLLYTQQSIVFLIGQWQMHK